MTGLPDAALDAPPLRARCTIDRPQVKAKGGPAMSGKSAVLACAGGRLCGGSVIVLQQSTQSRTTSDRSVSASRCRDGEEQLVAEALMIPFMMVVLDELANRSAQRVLAHKNQSVQARFLDRSHEALRVRIEIGGAWG